MKSAATFEKKKISSCYAFVLNNKVSIYSLFRSVRDTSEGESEWTWKILKLLAPKCLAKNEEEVLEMIKEALITTVSFPAGKKRKYIFKFKKNPEFILERQDYNTRGVYKQL